MSTARKPCQHVLMWQPISAYVYSDYYNNACCFECQKGFKAGNMIIETNTIQRRYHPLCYTKTQNYIVQNIPHCTIEVGNYWLLNAQNKRKIHIHLFPEMIPKELRYQTHIIETIKLNNLSDESTAKWARIFDIDSHLAVGNNDCDCNLAIFKQCNPMSLKKDEVLSDLYSQYFNTQKAHQKNNILAFGYCKKEQQELNLNIPVYLIQIVVKFFPINYYVPK